MPTRLPHALVVLPEHKTGLVGKHNFSSTSAAEGTALLTVLAMCQLSLLWI